MSSLTPTGRALDRATPGFDALVNVIQSTTDRISRNREFARELSERKNLMQFQSDLEFESRKRAMVELLPHELTRARALQDIQLTGQKAIMNYQNNLNRQNLGLEAGIRRDEREHAADLQVDTTQRIAENQLRMQIDNYDELTDLEIDRQNRVIRGTMEATLDQYQRQTNIDTAGRLAVVEAQLAGQRDQASNTLDDFIKTNFALAVADPSIIIQQPRFTDEGQIMPVNVQLGEDTVEMTWNEYMGYLSLQNERLKWIQKYENLLETRSSAISEVNLDGRLGTGGIRSQIELLNKHKHDFGLLQNIINRQTNYSIAYESGSSKDARLNIFSTVNTIRPAFVPGSDTHSALFGRMPRGINYNVSKDSPNFGSQFGRLQDWVTNNLTYGAIQSTITRSTSGAKGDIAAPLRESFGKINSNMGLLAADGSVPTDHRNMVFNWEFDPNANQVSLNDMFITIEEATNKIWNQMAGVENNDIERSNNVFTNPALQRYQRNFD